MYDYDPDGMLLLLQRVIEQAHKDRKENKSVTDADLFLHWCEEELVLYLETGECKKGKRKRRNHA